MKYVITGGAGFIGSNLVDRLLKDNHQVVILDNLSSGFLSYVPLENNNCKFIKVDISDFDSLIKHESEYKNVNGVFHLAAQSRIQPAVYNPDLAHDNNVVGTYNVLKMMRKNKIPKIVFSSSSSIYGLKNHFPQVESMPPDCLNPYSVSKYIAEQYIKTWCKLYEIDGACLRYFNVWGPREVIHLRDVAPIMGLFFRKLIQEDNPLTIIGDGEQRRDFTHVFDVVDANIKAMEFNKKITGEVFNIGTGKNYSILELANIILKSLGLDESFKEFLSRRPAESRITCANISKAKEWFNWSPKIVLEDEILNHKEYYIEKFHSVKMKIATSDEDRKALQDTLQIIKNESHGGDILEFGVYEGASLCSIISFINENDMKNKIYGFDSFSGLPDSEYHWKKGEAASTLENTLFLLKKELKHISNVVLHKGIYEEEFKGSIKEKIDIDYASLIHIDCDLSASHKHVLNICKDIMRKGTFIAIHDWDYDKIRDIWVEFVKENNIVATSHLERRTQIIWRIDKI